MIAKYINRKELNAELHKLYGRGVGGSRFFNVNQTLTTGTWSPIDIKKVKVSDIVTNSKYFRENSTLGLNVNDDTFIGVYNNKGVMIGFSTTDFNHCNIYVYVDNSFLRQVQLEVGTDSETQEKVVDPELNTPLKQTAEAVYNFYLDNPERDSDSMLNRLFDKL